MVIVLWYRGGVNNRLLFLSRIFIARSSLLLGSAAFENAFRGYRVREVPVVMKERVAGTSMFSGKLAPALYVAKMFLTILVVVLREKIFRPPEAERV